MLKLSTLAERLNLKIHSTDPNNSDPEITGVAPIETADAGELSFISNAKYAAYLKSSRVSAVVVANPLDNCTIPQLIHPAPHLAFAKIAGLFYQPDHGPQVVSEQAFVHPSAQIAEFVTLYPGAYVGERAILSKGCVLYPGVFVGAHAKVGHDTVLYPNVVIGERCVIGAKNIIHAGSVIGADGFGFAPDQHEIVKIPQTGIVRTEDDVEMGGLCTVDRATMGETLVGKSCKFDSKVHIGHNAQIGSHTMFSAGTAVGGSAKIGNWVLAGGQVGIAGHIKIGDRVQIGAKAGVISDTEAKQKVMGFPAVPAMQWRRGLVYQKKLSDYEKRIQKLEEQLALLTQSKEG